MTQPLYTVRQVAYVVKDLDADFSDWEILEEMPDVAPCTKLYKVAELLLVKVFNANCGGRP